MTINEEITDMIWEEIDASGENHCCLTLISLLAGEIVEKVQKNERQRIANMVRQITWTRHDQNQVSNEIADMILSGK